MISGENLPFCAADSNKYIGRIPPHVFGSSFFFPVLHLNSEIPISAESYTFVPKNVRIFMLSTILEENLVQSNLLLQCGLRCHRKEKKQLKEGRKRETEGLKRSKEAL